MGLLTSLHFSEWCGKRLRVSTMVVAGLSGSGLNPHKQMYCVYSTLLGGPNRNVGLPATACNSSKLPFEKFQAGGGIS